MKNIEILSGIITQTPQVKVFGVLAVIVLIGTVAIAYWYLHRDGK